jgi:NitT/TauT family transport system substrate-binding protein
MNEPASSGRHWLRKGQCELIRPYRFIGAFLLLVLTIAAMWHTWRGNREANVVEHHVRIGTNRALGTVIPYVAEEKKFFKARHVNVQIVDFNDVTTLMEAFSSGQIDVAMCGIAPSAIWQAKGVPLKVVASANGGGHILMTREGTGIRILRDLEGKTIATPKPGTVTDTLFRAHLMQDLAGLNPEKDIRIVPDMSAADMPTVLFVSREVDAAITWEPFASQAEAKFKNAKVIYDAAEEWRKENPASHQLYPVNVVIARQQFIDQHPEDLRRFIAAHADAVSFINDHADQANEIIARTIRLDKAIVEAARRRIDYTSEVDVTGSLKTLEWSRRLGYLKTMPAPDTLFDLRFLPPEQRP